MYPVDYEENDKHMCVAECSKEIYQKLADVQSRMIYLNRLNYSLTEDRCFIEDMVKYFAAESTLDILLRGA